MNQVDTLKSELQSNLELRARINELERQNEEYRENLGMARHLVKTAIGVLHTLPTNTFFYRAGIEFLHDTSSYDLEEYESRAIESVLKIRKEYN